MYRSKPKSSTWTQVNQIEKDAECQRPSSRNSQNPKKGAWVYFECVCEGTAS